MSSTKRTSQQVLAYVEEVIAHMPSDWLRLTTHRLDIYNESLAKIEFLAQFETLFEANKYSTEILASLSTAYDYIRLGHPLSCILEWTLASLNGVDPKGVISFSSAVTPILAILRTNLLRGEPSLIVYTDVLPAAFDAALIRRVYGYSFEVQHVSSFEELPAFDGTVIAVAQAGRLKDLEVATQASFHVSVQEGLGSILFTCDPSLLSYVKDIQHVRRRETIAMTPSSSLEALKAILGDALPTLNSKQLAADKQAVADVIREVTGTSGRALFGSSGLSIQYAIMMGLVDDAMQNEPGKSIKFIVPTNCYGGTNDQARRVAACLDHVEVVDLHVDGENDMVSGLKEILASLAQEDAVPYIIAEIPTNPRVEVPNLDELKAVLTEVRKTSSGDTAVDPVFILDQTFCPNVHFLGQGEVLSEMRAISYSSGSKFPSGGKVTAGYVVGNEKAASLMDKVALHLEACDNEATALQYSILAEQLPSMLERIAGAYKHTRTFVNFVKEKLPEAKINFVSEALAAQGFTPSVFSLDLPTKGSTEQEREDYKRALNLRLINLMISEIREESKFCVSYGQLKGVYWTVPATSTQGTTKEGDKDYIVRVSLSPDMNMQKHMEVFSAFVDSI